MRNHLDFDVMASGSSLSVFVIMTTREGSKYQAFPGSHRFLYNLVTAKQKLESTLYVEEKVIPALSVLADCIYSLNGDAAWNSSDIITYHFYAPLCGQQLNKVVVFANENFLTNLVLTETYWASAKVYEAHVTVAQNVKSEDDGDTLKMGKAHFLF